jgi:spectinomycin phosphotransferase
MENMETPEYKKIINKENIHIIESEYNIKIHNAKQLFIGCDKNTFVYRLESDNNKVYFLKIRTGVFNESSINIPYELSQKIGRHIIEPLKTIKDHLYIKMSDYTIILYPFILGKSGREIDLSEKQWAEFGKLLYKIHSFQLSKEIHVIPYEKYNTEYRIKLIEYIQKINEKQTLNDYAKQFSDLLISKQKLINIILKRTEELFDEIIKMDRNYCLCHGDIHAGNLFISDNNELYVVDWDTLIMAPKERDLMFIGGGIANKWNTKNEENYFYKGYGRQNNINKIIMAYYRYERIIEDVVEFYDQFFEKDTKKKNQKIILEVVNNMFASNNVVELALLLDK